MKRIWLVMCMALLVPACGEEAPSTADDRTGNPPNEEAPPQPEVTAQDMLDDADAMFRTRKYLASRAVYEKAWELARLQGDRRVQVEALSQIARTYSLGRKLSEARKWLAQAEALADVKEPWGYTRFLGVRGILEREEGDKPGAVKTFEHMYAYATEQGLHRRAIDAAHHVAIAAPPDEQIVWGRKGIAAAERLGERSWLAVLWNNLGATYEDLKRYDESHAAYLEARKYHHQGKEETPKMIADWAVAHILRLKGDLDEARTWATKTLAWAERIHAAEGERAASWVGYCQEELGHLAQLAGNHAVAAATWRKARAAFVAGGMETHWPAHLEELDALIAQAEKAAGADADK